MRRHLSTYPSKAALAAIKTNVRTATREGKNQNFLELLGRDAMWVAGVVAALTALATIAGNALVEFFARLCGRRTSLLIWAAVVAVAAAAGVGLVESFWPAVALLLIATGAAGVGTPAQRAYLHQVVPSSERATVVSSVSLASSAGGIGGQLGLGWIARAQSVAAGYVVGRLAMLLAVPPLLLRRMRERADVTVGRKAGTRGPRAAQGLPQVASVDTTARQPEGSAP
jgi:MFS family permease